MRNKRYKVSKAPLVVSIIFTSLNLIAAAVFACFAAISLPLAFNPERGTEGLGLAIGIVIMAISGIIILILGIIGSLCGLKYYNSNKSNEFSKFLVGINGSFVLTAIVVFLITVLAARNI